MSKRRGGAAARNAFKKLDKLTRDGFFSAYFETDLTDDLVAEMMEALREDIHNAADVVLFAVAQDARKFVRKGLLGQRFEHQPLSARWAAFKKKRKLDDRILIASKRYVNSIDVRPKETEKGGFGYPVTPHKTKVHPGYPGKPNRGQLTMERIGRIHEYGARRTTDDGKVVEIPPRPHWRPTAEHFRKKSDEIESDILSRTMVEKNARVRAAKRAQQNENRRKRAKAGKAAKKAPKLK